MIGGGGMAGGGGIVGGGGIAGGLPVAGASGRSTGRGSTFIIVIFRIYLKYYLMSTIIHFEQYFNRIY